MIYKNNDNDYYFYFQREVHSLDSLYVNVTKPCSVVDVVKIISSSSHKNYHSLHHTLLHLLSSFNFINIQFFEEPETLESRFLL